MKRLIGLGLVGVSHTIIPSIPNINVILVQKVVLLETISKHIFNHRKQTIIFVFLLIGTYFRYNYNPRSH